MGNLHVVVAPTLAPRAPSSRCSWRAESPAAPDWQSRVIANLSHPIRRPALTILKPAPPRLSSGVRLPRPWSRKTA
jgi:hypothetical protein